MTLNELFHTTTIVNPDDGVTVTVFPVARGWLVRMTDDDSGNIVGQGLFTNEPAALAYAHKIAGVAAQWRDSMKTDNNGRQWRLIGRRPGVELWRADDAELMAHGWAVCDHGDEPDHATCQTTTMEAIARQWFAQ